MRKELTKKSYQLRFTAGVKTRCTNWPLIIKLRSICRNSLRFPSVLRFLIVLIIWPVRSSNSLSRSNVEFATRPWFQLMALCGCAETINKKKFRKLIVNILLRKRLKKSLRNLVKKVKNHRNIKINKMNKKRKKNLAKRAAKKLDKA